MKTQAQFILAVAIRALVRAAGRFIFRLHTDGTGNVPEKGGALLVANHVSFLDFMIIVCAVPRHVCFVMNADIYRKPALKWLFKALNCIPVSPRGGNNSYHDFNNAVASRVNAGHLVVIFAEGTVSRTGQILEFRKGVEHLASLIHSPVIPIHLHNVQGSPLSFIAGSKQMTRFTWRNLRQDIYVKIGRPVTGLISAFRLRQVIKELEAENFAIHIASSPSLAAQIRKCLAETKSGCWSDLESSITFHKLQREIALLSSVMNRNIRRKERVAVLLPKNQDSLLINLWCMVHEITVINIKPDFTNEERFFVMNHSGADLLITTIDLEFARFAPNAREVVYMEHIREAMESGSTLQIFEKKITSFSRKVRSAFQAVSREQNPVTIIYERAECDELNSFSLSQANILAVLMSIQQIYPVSPGSCILSNLPLHSSYGFVLELLFPLFADVKIQVAPFSFDEETFPQYMTDAQPELIVASPEQLKSLARLLEVRNLPYLQKVFTADTDPADSSIVTLQNRGIEVFLCAGSNLTSSLFAMNLCDYKGLDIAGRELRQENSDNYSIGKAIPGVAVKTCNDDLQELKPGETGTLWIKGPCVSESAKDTMQTNIHEMHGWVNSGLRASITNKGFIYLQSQAS